MIIKEVLALTPQDQKPVSIAPNFGLSFNTLGDFVTLIMPLIFSIAGMLVAFYFLIGAFELITSQGDKAHIVSARSKIYHSIIGLVLLLLLFLVLQYILDIFGLKGPYKQLDII